MSAHKGGVVIVGHKNQFACLASDSEGEEVSVNNSVEVVSPPPQYRVWEKDDTSANRFTVGQTTKEPSVFSSPFTKSSKRWARPRFQEDGDGWTSISWTQPQFVDDASTSSSATSAVSDEDIPVVETASTQEFPSLLLRSTIDEDTSVTVSTAAMWAERVKKQLDKAEAVREEKGRLKAIAEDPVKLDDRLSFFRRARVVEE